LEKPEEGESFFSEEKAGVLQTRRGGNSSEICRKKKKGRFFNVTGQVKVIRSQTNKLDGEKV